MRVLHECHPGAVYLHFGRQYLVRELDLDANKVHAEPAPVVKVHELADSSVNFVVRPWVKTDDYWDVYWDVTREVKMRFDREGISIPFPQRDVHIYREDGGEEVGA